MPTNRSYHVFILEDGEDLSLVTQVFRNAKPSLIVTSDTLIYLSHTITRISSSQNCEHISARQLQQCIMERVKKDFSLLNITCLPFIVQRLFPDLQAQYPQCENETKAVEYYLKVSKAQKKCHLK